MTPSFATRLDALSAWRLAVAQRTLEFSLFLGEHALVDDAAATSLSALRERLGSEKLIVAFVAEFSRGKSELINAIFFADTGRRVLPATPGRTTMCPVELAWHAGDPAMLSLLPIDTRKDGFSLSEMRARASAWTRLPLALHDPEQLAAAMQEVTRTRSVTRDEAVALGFWNDANPEDNPPLDDHGLYEVPAWRHALINYPHPLLKQGLVVLDTPGLNAIGAEPELTLSLLPSAHATVFVLGADTGVTKSDLGVWRDHLGAHAPTRFVVLNKIDALLDPLATAEQIELQINEQRRTTARTLGVAPQRVFALSARQALAARVAGDAAALAQSRLPDLEAALGAQLLPQRSDVLQQLVLDTARKVQQHAERRLTDARRQLTEQMLELRGLRGKSSARIELMLQRVDLETAEFEQCTTRLQAMRSIHGRMLREAVAGLSSERIRAEVQQMQAAMDASLLKFGAKKAFVTLCARLRALIKGADQQSAEVLDMLGATFALLNAEYGFSLALTPAPSLQRFATDLHQIEDNYLQYLGLTQALRLSSPKFMDQFRRMLLSKLRVVFETASGELELWNKSVSAQVDAQLRDRRRNYKRRRESLERIQGANGELEGRIAEIEAQDLRLQHLAAQLHTLAEGLCEQARTGPSLGAEDDGDELASGAAAAAATALQAAGA